MTEHPFPAIRFQEVSKSYRHGWRTIDVLNHVSFQVEVGEVVGLMGSNGAGKTTTLKILTGLIRPSRGEVEIFGTSIRNPHARQHLSFLPESPQFPHHLTAKEFLGFSAQLLAPPVPEKQWYPLLEEAGLMAAATKRIATFSKGMKQRLGMIHVLLAHSPLLLLDEPMSGLDSPARQDMIELLRTLQQQGRTLFFSTHSLEEALTLCDRIVFLHRGYLLPLQTSAAIWKQIPRLVRVRPASEGTRQSLERLPDVHWKTTAAASWDLYADHDKALNDAIRLLNQHQAQIISLTLPPEALDRILAYASSNLNHPNDRS